MRFPRSPAEIVLYTSLSLIFLLLALARPPISFYALPLAPIALAALLYEVVGGTLVALAAMAGVGVLIALDPDAARRALTLTSAWPILLVYLAAGPAVGWLASRERESERRMVAAARRLHVVQEIAQAINSSFDLTETLRTIAAETRRLVAFEQAVVMLRQGDVLRVVAQRESPFQASHLVDQQFPLRGTAVGWVVEHRRAWRGGPPEIARYPDTRAVCAPGQACLIMPLLFQQAAIGVFALSGQDVAALDESELTNLNRIASQMAIALERARLFALERERARQLAAISTAGRDIAATLDLERTLRLVMSKAAETLPMDAGALLQLEPASQKHRVVVSHNISAEHVTQITFAFDEGVPGWVVQHRRPLIIPDADADARVHPAVLEDGVQSVLALPLVAREQVVGVLNLYSKSSQRAFDQDAVLLAQVFADQAAVAIENARLVEQLRRAATELESRVELRTQQLRESQAQVVRSEKLAVVGRLAASLAHEVNNPLQAIALQLQLIYDEALSPDACQRLEIVQGELARIAGIVKRLLDLQRPTPGERAPYDVASLLDDVLALAGKQLQQRGVTVVRQDDPGLPPVWADGSQLKQVFLNLVLNAADAMPAGGQLNISTARKNGALAITFADTGVGMPAEVLAQLFEPFFSTKSEGSGLGLAVSHEIVSQHGGRLEVSSTPGAGSTFCVRLPLQQLLEH